MGGLCHHFQAGRGVCQADQQHVHHVGIYYKVIQNDNASSPPDKRQVRLHELAVLDVNARPWKLGLSMTSKKSCGCGTQCDYLKTHPNANQANNKGYEQAAIVTATNNNHGGRTQRQSH